MLPFEKLAEFPNQGTAALVDAIPLPWGFALDYVVGAEEDDVLLLSGFNFTTAGVAMVLSQRKEEDEYYLLVPMTPGAAREVIEWALTPERR